jgi:hypothetical protein
MARVSVLLPDAGPLFTLAAADALDLLGAAELDVVLTDEVSFEATRAFLVGLERAGAIASADEVWERARRVGRNANPAIVDIPSVVGEPTEWVPRKKARPAE